MIPWQLALETTLPSNSQHHRVQISREWLPQFLPRHLAMAQQCPTRMLQQPNPPQDFDGPQLTKEWLYTAVQSLLR